MSERERKRNQCYDEITAKCVYNIIIYIQATSIPAAMTRRQLLYKAYHFPPHTTKGQIMLNNREIVYFFNAASQAIIIVQCQVYIKLVWFYSKAYNNCSRSSLSMDSSSLFLLSEDVLRTLTFPEDWAELDDLPMDGGRGNSTGSPLTLLAAPTFLLDRKSVV